MKSKGRGLNAILLFLLVLVAAACLAGCRPAQVSTPTLSETGVATWKNVAGSEKYTVQLYRDGLACGTPVDAADGETGCSVLSLMRDAGEGIYTVRVTAIGKSASDIGKESEDSNPQTIAKAMKVTALSISSDGTAAWTATDASSYDLKLYKDSTVIFTETDANPGCDLLDIMRENGAGSYAITVTAKSDTGLMLDSDESKASDPVHISYLQTEQPVWSGAVLKWQPDANASGYEVILYKDGSAIDTKELAAGETSFDFKEIMEQNPSGTFTAAVQAIGGGFYLSSPVSEHSLAVVNPPGLAQVCKPSFSSDGVVNWTNVANAAEYKVQLYRDGIASGDPIIAADGKTGCALLAAMRDAGAGSYTVKVAAKGGSGFSDGPMSEVSEVQVVSKADKVTGVSLSNEGLVTWNETNGESYELKIYKNGSVVETVENAMQEYSCHDVIKANGAGKYYVTVTAKSDSGLLVDSDMSEKSNVQTASRTHIRNGTVENAFKPATSVYKESDGIIITSVEPSSGIKDGVNAKFTIELEYNLASREKGMIIICANIDIGTSHSQNYIQVSEYGINKGRGTLRFETNIVPKKWSNGDPFFVAAKLTDENNDVLIVNTPPYNLTF